MLAKRKYPWIDIPKEWRGRIQVLREYISKLHYLVVKWKKPAQGKIKCNTNRVSRGNPGTSAYSFCPKDDRGVLMYAQAEAVGIKSNM